MKREVDEEYERISNSNEQTELFNAKPSPRALARGSVAKISSFLMLSDAFALESENESNENKDQKLQTTVKNIELRDPKKTSENKKRNVNKMRICLHCKFLYASKPTSAV